MLHSEFLLSVHSHADYRNHSRPRMTADHSADIIHHDIRYSHFLRTSSATYSASFRQLPCGIITMSGIFPSHASIAISTILFIAFFSATFFLDNLKFSFIIQINDRLDLHHAAKHCRCFGDPSSTVQMMEIIHRYIMTDMKFIFFHPLCNLFHCLPGCFLTAALYVKEVLLPCRRKAYPLQGSFFPGILLRVLLPPSSYYWQFRSAPKKNSDAVHPFLLSQTALTSLSPLPDSPGTSQTSFLL